jgi:hypothetical protein
MHRVPGTITIIVDVGAIEVKLRFECASQRAEAALPSNCVDCNDERYSRPDELPAVSGRWSLRNQMPNTAPATPAAYGTTARLVAMALSKFT